MESFVALPRLLPPLVNPFSARPVGMYAGAQGLQTLHPCLTVSYAPVAFFYCGGVRNLFLGGLIGL